MARPLRILSTALITAGIVILLDVGVTLAWKEPLSTLYGSFKQGEAEDSLRELEREFPTAADLRQARRTGPGAEAQARVLAGLFAERVERGQGIGRIEIPAIDLDIVVVEGTDTNSLQRGPGHYTLAADAGLERQGDGSAFPGQGRTIGIAGHRTTYLAPFREIDEIEPGDEIEIEMPYASFTYVVQRHEIVEPGEVRIVRDVGYERLVLTACHPLYSAAQRYVQFAKLDEVRLPAAG